MMTKQLVLMALLAGCAPLSAAGADDGTLDHAGLELGGRYWYSTGRIGYGYYGDTTTSLLVSRLTYDQLTANSGEIYARGDTPWGIFIKGFAGLGAIAGGRLIDEDFPPVTFPYSETSSTTSGSLSYGTVDLGYSSFASRTSGSVALPVMAVGTKTSRPAAAPSSPATPSASRQSRSQPPLPSSTKRTTGTCCGSARPQT